MEEDWVFVISEKDISLFQNENNYKILFNVKNTENTYNNIIDIVKDNDLFELLFELNKDLIESCSLKQLDSGTHYVNMKVINKKYDYFDYDNFTMHINYANRIEERKGVIYSIPFNNNNLEKNEIYLSNFRIEIGDEKDNVSFLIKYSFDKELFDSNLINTSLSMYILKILYRLKLYFE
jgi:hypothetical protein